MTTRQDLIDAIEARKKQVDALASAVPEERWSIGVYENGWNVQQLLAHVASTSGSGTFVLSLANLPAGTGLPGGAAFDNDAFNAQQVAMREGRTAREIADEVIANCHRDIQAIEAAPDDLLAKHFKAPWDVEGSVAEVILAAVNGHYGAHLDEIAAALA